MDDTALGDAAHVQSTLRQLLARHLGLTQEAIDPHQSFDEMGLDSIDGVLLSGELSDCLGIDLPPEFLLKYRSLDKVLEGLLAMCGEGVEEVAQTEIPLFVFPGGAGRYTSMSRLADCDARLIVEIVPLGEWRDWLIAGCDLSPLVDRACGWIEARYPEGALRVGGHSLGGQIAFAVALALRARGRSIGGLYLFDSSAEQHKIGKVGARALVARTLTSLYRKTARLAGHFGSVDVRAEAVEEKGSAQAGRSLKNGVELLELAPARALLARWPADRLPGIADPRGIRVDNAIRMKIFDIMWRLWATRLSPGEGSDLPVTLFRARSPGPPDLGWLQFCCTLRIVRVDGTHNSMIQPPHIQNLAARLLSAFSSDLAAGE